MSGTVNQPAGTDWKVWVPIWVAVIALVGVLYQNSTQSRQFSMKLEEDRREFDTKFIQERADADALKDRELHQRVKDFQLTFYQRQMAAYSEITETTAKISLAKTVADAEKDIDKLQEIIVGKLATVADDNVRLAVFDFNNTLRPLRRDQPMPEGVQYAAYEVSKACGDSLRAAFDLRVYGALPPEKDFKPLRMGQK